MVRLRHLHPPDTTLGANVGVKRTTSKLMVLVELLNLTFDLEPHVWRDSNVKFAPLGHFSCYGKTTMVDESPARYDATTIRLHWLTAFIVLLLWILGQISDLFPHGPINSGLWSIHVVMGFVLVPLVVFRVFWRHTGGTRLDRSGYGALYVMTKGAHYVLQGLLILAIALGVANAFIRGYNLFGIVSLPHVGDPALRRPVTGAHELAANLLLVLVALHAAVALFHHYALRDDVLQRMLPGWRRSSKAAGLTKG
ncbi:cytochrome b561 [Chelatococcus asaccharovorans]|uniref:Cytochrome b561 n=2 Tax=Chelatococcus asaccharovorans TaxID=28210 RepID=A0A2V3TUI6_9HYPH|nr:cytochrome b561 [Chelatococcus asaccharovorans]CAH1676496.1 Cytochrome b561 [Chelatococcus asaccharovorans]